MVLESTMVCVDNSEYMRNGDFVPTRLQAQQDAINLICQSKTRSNPENNVGLVTLTKGDVLVTLTSDAGTVMSKLHQVQPSGYINFTTGIRVAHLALKHRLGKNHKMRIIAFIGSPVEGDDKELQKLAKRLKKEKVNVDIVNFGEDAANTDVLTNFINTLNGKDGTSCHIVTVACGGSGGMVGAAGQSTMSMMELAGMSEDEQIAFAMQMSLQQQQQATATSPEASSGGEEKKKEEPMEVDVDSKGGAAAEKASEEEEEEAVIDDAEFLQEVLGGLPGVDTSSDQVQRAITQLTAPAAADKPPAAAAPAATGDTQDKKVKKSTKGEEDAKKKDKGGSDK